MVRIAYQTQFPDKKALGGLVLFFHEGAVKAPRSVPAEVRQTVTRLAALKDFTGKSGQTHVVPLNGGPVGRLVCVGLGEAGKFNPEGLRRAAGAAAKQMAGLNLDSAAVVVPDKGKATFARDFAEIISEGFLLGAYKFETYKDKKPGNRDERKELGQMVLVDAARVSGRASQQTGTLRAEAVCLARTLGNQPANVLTPTQLAREARAVAKRRGLKIRVLERAELEKMGMGMFMGVAQGSRQPPKLIVLEHRPKGAKQTLLFVGKGITFDSGGISLKPGQAMDEMKFDMCGAAAVLGALDVIGATRPQVNVVGVMPACENLPDGNSVKPGDILKSYTGKYVEVLNTDAEGRLILGDALAYAIKTYRPDAVVDLATLTGACVIALGHYATGAITNDEGLLEKVVQAGKSSGDTVWPLPSFPEYEDGLKGKYAELQNIGPREGGAITAGLFLKNFVGKVPWVHLDIAGTAWGVKSIGHIPNDGATGVGVRLLIDLARKWSSRG